LKKFRLWINAFKMTTIPEIKDAKPLGGFRVWLRFESGVQGDVDLSKYLKYGPIFEPLADEAFFRKFSIQGGTLAWPNGADIAPERLYELVSTTPTCSANSKVS
jgi:hypothetical protein